MHDPIAQKLDEEWTPHVVDEPNVTKVRAWLKQQEEADLRLYLSTFEAALDTKHRARAGLLREELARRERPPPDRVAQIMAAARSSWFIAAAVVLGLVVGGIASFKEDLCELMPNIYTEQNLTIEDIFPGGQNEKETSHSRRPIFFGNVICD